MDKKTPPTTLYKFRSWNDPHHKTLLTEGKLWVPTAASLNDPLDCLVLNRYDLMPHEALVERFTDLLLDNLPNLKIEEARAKSLARIEELGVLDPQRKAKVLRGFANHSRENYCVLSFATNFNNPVLWSHYADSHKGFCVGIKHEVFHTTVESLFDKTGMPFYNSWVQYVSERPDFVPSNNENAELELFWSHLTMKTMHWQYENEYRYLFGCDHAFSITLLASSVTEIILGSGLPEAELNSICKMVDLQFPGVKILKGQLKGLSNEIEFVSL